MKVVKMLRELMKEVSVRRFKFENKLVAWHAMCDVVHFCLCEKERKEPQWEHFSEADIFSSV